MLLKKIIDLRSDTVTSPCDDMRQVMARAEVGDEFYGEDVTTKRLENYCADLFGKEAALFTISGTMSNQIAIRCHTHAGDEIILDSSYHINYYESGPTTDLGKVSMNLVRSANGIMTESDIKNALFSRHRSNLSSRATLICLENTINFHSGKIYPLQEMKNIFDFSKDNKMTVHLDGARLFNACVAKDISPTEYAAQADSVMISFSKGLGAPLGSVLLADKNFIEKAKKFKKWYGGGMHQSGIIAAAALYALQNNVARLQEDHEHSKLLAKLLSEEKRFKINFDDVETNILMLSLQKMNVTSDIFVARAKSLGVLLYPWGPKTVRLVTHKNISKSDIFAAGGMILNSAKEFE
jgi:threonine aldolase